ncbi:MAG: TIM barrel protein [Clostridia bacterium]|nr:TIM barrel protein [Clostridia bacterium]
MQKKYDRPLFGPAGGSDEFHASGKKSTVDAPGWIRDRGLDAYEFQGGNGMRFSDALFSSVGAAAADAGIAMSVHAPYFISLSGIDPEKRLKSVNYIYDSLRAAKLMGADTVVIHTGSAAKISREEAMELAEDTLRRTIEYIDANGGTGGVRLGLETMGKKNQLGTLDEVIRLCRIDPAFCPVVDFGHLNARECGGVFPDAGAYRRVFGDIADALGAEYAETLHCHFSKIMFTDAGEKKHLRFADDPGNVWGPDFLPLAEVIARDGLRPRIISESAGDQDADALAMKRAWKAAKENV